MFATAMRQQEPTTTDDDDDDDDEREQFVDVAPNARGKPGPS
jgi:hypothetical protein